MILVTGATGNVGVEVVRALAEAAEPVRALVRDPSGTDAPHGVEVVAGDLTAPETLSFDGVRAMFLLPGYPGVAKAAAQAGVEHIVQLSGVSAATGDTANAITRYMMAAEEEATGSGVAWTILRPCAFASNALRWLPQLRDGDVIKVPFPGVRTAVLDPQDLGTVAATVLRAGSHHGEILWPTGPHPLTPAEQVAIVAEATGRDLTCLELTDEQARAQMLETTPVEYVDAFFDFYANGAIDESIVRPTVEQILGRAPRTFRQWADDHASAFR
ncbi:NAD(P)H-binding protein [Nocardia coubleae]|uniref:NmrA family NAD(P)-binding protein n=1 Tax=Nocardia coubleae TaxID=356147 RepID=A0A846W148_9NOCA|nr:NAD(P)H-binding protein [Nocardia coubleae]NKX86550.1 NmrA family NAD(P)-binding protein [Nocardia coubleae]